jgi:hypothetical protein
MLRRATMSCLFALAAIAASIPTARATPAQIVILRHGEKHDAYRLCRIGAQRSLALAGRYLGKGGEASLFAAGGGPAAFFAITLHTLELISPAAQTWGKPVIMYTSIPVPGHKDADSVSVLNRRTQEAARDVLTNPQWNGKTVVMVWEHHHIADHKLEKQFPGQKVTLRQLLNLDAVAEVPRTWSGQNYDYFWIVDYAGTDRPARFRTRKQTFSGSYAQLPSNDWDTPHTFPPGSGCVH